MPAPTGITEAMLARTPAAVRDRLTSLQRSYDELRAQHQLLLDGLNNVPGHNTDTRFEARRLREEDNRREEVPLPDGAKVRFSLAPVAYRDKFGMVDSCVLEARVKTDHHGRSYLEVAGYGSALVLRPNVTNVLRIDVEDVYFDGMKKRLPVKLAPPCDAKFKDGRTCTAAKGHKGPHNDRVIIHNRTVPTGDPR